jgi:uncharacterized protein YbjT (DUF2867 family)
MRILLTGANGYIGMRLLPILLEAGHEVVCCVRNAKRYGIDQKNHRQIEIIEADFLDASSLDAIPKNIDTAFYLIHSMTAQTGNFLKQEEAMARNFVHYIESTTATQIIYLTGIASADSTSEHFESRLATEKIIKASTIAHTVFRAAIIVGSGSASFEIIRDLVEKLPVMVAPSWLKSRCQPIGIRDVLSYLSQALGNVNTYNQVFDIGGPDILSYKDMLLQFAEVRGLKRKILTMPMLSPRLSSMWLYFVTSTNIHLARNLVDSMKFDVLMQNRNVENVIPHDCITYRKAVELAFLKVGQNAVSSSWKDALSSSGSLLNDPDQFSEVPQYGCFKDLQIKPIEVSRNQVLENIWHIGGYRGYYHATFLWKIRGYLDKLSGGIGLRRGRRSLTELNPGDALDFWRVLVADKAHGRLLLYAEMKLPGEAWLEFKLAHRSGQDVLVQTATFRPKGLFGRLYWYSVWPFHIFVFSGMAEKISSFQPKTESDANVNISR